MNKARAITQHHGTITRAKHVQITIMAGLSHSTSKPRAQALESARSFRLSKESNGMKDTSEQRQYESKRCRCRCSVKRAREQEEEGHACTDVWQCDRGQAECAVAWSVCCAVLCLAVVMSTEKKHKSQKWWFWLFCACRHLISVKNIGSTKRMVP